MVLLKRDNSRYFFKFQIASSLYLHVGRKLERPLHSQTPEHLDCKQSLPQKSARKNAKLVSERDRERDVRAAMQRAASSEEVGRRAKRESAMISYNKFVLQC